MEMFSSNSSVIHIPQHGKTHLLPSFSLSLSLLIVGVGLLALFVLNHEDIKQ